MTNVSEAISPTIPDDADPEALRIAATALFSARDMISIIANHRKVVGTAAEGVLSAWAALLLDAAHDMTWATEDRDLRCDDLAARLGEHGIFVRGTGNAQPCF